MDSDKLSTTVAYLCNRLNPEEKAELEQLLGGAVPDVAEDAFQCKRGLSFDRLPERLKRNKLHAMRNGPVRMAADAAAADEYAKHFPNADRLEITMGRIGNTLARLRNAVVSTDDATRLTDAEAELSAARDDVQAAINKWPAPSNDRRWIASLPRAGGLERGTVDASVLVGGSKPTDSRLSVFDRAVEREKRAKAAVASAKAAIEAATVLPVRVALANAVEVLTDKRESASAARLSVDRARLYLTEAEGRHATAADALESAKTGAQARLEAAAVSGEAPVGASSLRSARVAEMDAQDDAEACRRALGRVEKSLEDAEADERVAQENADRAVDAVLLTLLDREPILAAERERFKRYAVFQHLTRLYDFHTCDQTQRQSDVNFAARHSLNADIDDWKEIQARAVELWRPSVEPFLPIPKAEFTA